MRLIDADAIEYCDDDSNLEGFAYVRKRTINAMPTIAAEPVKHGRWKGVGMGDYMCSWCATVVSGNEWHYCPNCGADMREVTE